MIVTIGDRLRKNAIAYGVSIGNLKFQIMVGSKTGFLTLFV